MALESDLMGDDEDVVQVDVEWLAGAQVQPDSVSFSAPSLGQLHVRFAPHSTLSRTGECIWAGSLLLAEWIIANRQHICSTYDVVLELGCGVGLVQMVMRALGIVCVATDLEAASSAALNGVTVTPLDWRDAAVPAGLVSPDARVLIVAADVVYDCVITEHLFAMLRALQAALHVQPAIVLACERRVVWLFGEPAPSSLAHDHLLQCLYGCVAGPLPLWTVPHVLPYARHAGQMELWAINRV